MKSSSSRKNNRRSPSRKRPISLQNKAHQLIGHPVLLVLKDGSQYVGVISSIKNGEILLSGTRGQIKLDASGAIQDQAQVSGLLGMLFRGGLGKGLGANTGTLSQLMPNLKLGMNMLRMIVPLFGSFFI